MASESTYGENTTFMPEPSEKNSWDCTRTNTGSLNGRWTDKMKGGCGQDDRAFQACASSKKGKMKS